MYEFEIIRITSFAVAGRNNGKHFELENVRVGCRLSRGHGEKIQSRHTGTAIGTSKKYLLTCQKITRGILSTQVCSSKIVGNRQIIAILSILEVLKTDLTLDRKMLIERNLLNHFLYGDGGYINADGKN